MAQSLIRAVVEPLPPAAVAELVAGLLRDGTGVALLVSGSSMAPFLKSGDQIQLEPAGRARLGEVVVRLCGVERLLIHRVVGGPDVRPLTRGDSAGAPDPPIQEGELLGRVRSVEREGRRRRLGLGPERLLLALLSRFGWLRPLLVAARSGRRATLGAA